MILTLWLQQTHEAFLFKVSVCGKGFDDATLSHQHEADGITERIRFVGSRQKKFHRLSMQVFVYPNDLDLKISKYCLAKVQYLLAGKATYMRQCDVFCQYIIARQTHTSILIAP